MYKFDSQSVELAVDPIRQAEEGFRQVQDTLNKKDIVNLAGELDSQGMLAAARKAAVNAVGWAQHLQADIKATIADYVELNEKGKNSLLFQDGRFSYGSFAAMTGLASVIGYESYQIYQFESSGKSLISDYNDVYSFRNTWVYKSGQQSASISQWSNYEMMLEALGLPLNAIEEYNEGLLESAMGSILGSLPDLRSAENFETFDQLEKYLGIENLDKWISALKKVVSAYAKAGAAFDEIKLDEEFKKLMEELPASVQEMVSGAIGSMLTAEYAEDITKMTDTIERLDTCIDVVMHCLNDYSVQVSYLDTWEDAMLNAGLDGGFVLSKIRELRETYQSDFTYALDKVEELITDEIKKTGKKELIKKVAELCPVVKWADLGLGLSSTVAKLQFGDEISAVQGLDGLYALDQNLTTSYQYYTELMQAGIATEADMQEAERLFNLLKQAKTKEYSHMLTLCEGRDIDLFNQYHAKYIELTGEPWKDYSAASIWKWDD